MGRATTRWAEDSLIRRGTLRGTNFVGQQTTMTTTATAMSDEREGTLVERFLAEGARMTYMSALGGVAESRHVPARMGRSPARSTSPETAQAQAAEPQSARPGPADRFIGTSARFLRRRVVPLLVPEGNRPATSLDEMNEMQMGIGAPIPLTRVRRPVESVAPDRVSPEVSRRISEDASVFDNATSLVGEIEGLTPELERAFEGGAYVVRIASPDGVADRIISPSQNRGQTIFGDLVGPDALRIYREWSARRGFSDHVLDSADLATARSFKSTPQMAALRETAARYGIRIEGAVTPQQAEYIRGILEMLPEGFLNTSYLRRIVLGSGTQGAAGWSAYDKGTVYIYSNILQGPSRDLLGLLLHEMGHSTGNRYALTADENRTGTSPDEIPARPDVSIPEPVRRRMHEDVRVLAGGPGWSNVVFALDWADGRQARIAYTSGSFSEFIAEFHLNYVVAGERLRSHIDAIAVPSLHEAYQRIYTEIRDRVFGGVEYSGGRPITRIAPEIEAAMDSISRAIDFVSRPNGRGWERPVVPRETIEAEISRMRDAARSLAGVPGREREAGRLASEANRLAHLISRGGVPGAMVDIQLNGREAVIVGDLHGNEEGLARILNTRDASGSTLSERLASNRAVLIIVGDAIHPSDTPLDAMDPSIRTLETIVRLQTEYPDAVFYTQGNHDVVYGAGEEAFRKGGIFQGPLFREALTDQRRLGVTRSVQEYFDSSPLIVRVMQGDEVVAIAGHSPIVRGGLTQSQAVSGRFGDGSRSGTSSIEHQLTWNRPGPRSGEYTDADVARMRATLGSTSTVFISGHTAGDTSAWQPTPGQVILQATTDYGGDLSVVRISPDARVEVADLAGTSGLAGIDLRDQIAPSDERSTRPPPADMPRGRPRAVPAVRTPTRSLPRSATAVGLAVHHANAHLADETGFRFAVEAELISAGDGETGTLPTVEVRVAGPEAEMVFMNTLKEISQSVTVENLGDGNYRVHDEGRGESLVTVRPGLELNVDHQRHLGEWLNDLPPAEREGMRLSRYSPESLESLTDHLIPRRWTRAELTALFEHNGITGRLEEIMRRRAARGAPTAREAP